MAISLSRELVENAFPGQIFVRLKDVANLVGLSPSTLYNQRSQGKFPLPTVVFGKFVMVPISGLVAFLEAMEAEALGIEVSPAAPHPHPALTPEGAREIKRRRGRPRRVAPEGGGV